MMKIQYNNLLTQIYNTVNEELEIDTTEGKELFLALSQALFEQFMKYKKKDEDAA